MAAPPTRLMSFEEFDKLPNPRGGRYELRHGDLVFVAPPKHNHYKLQQRLLRLLMRAAGDAGEIGTEMGFRPRPDYEYWYADVGFLSRTRWDQTPDRGNIENSPELVVEILSPSNTPTEMRRRRQVCLETGSREFWIVDMDSHQIEVSTPEGRVVTYASGQEIPLLFGGSLSVDEIFG